MKKWRLKFIDRVEFIKKMRQAIQDNELEIVKQLLELNEEIMLPSTAGNVLSTATAFGTPKVIEYLMERRFDERSLCYVQI